MSKTSTTPRKFNIDQNYIPKNKKNKDIRYTILYILAAAFLAILFMDSI